MAVEGHGYHHLTQDAGRGPDSLKAPPARVWVYPNQISAGSV